MGFFYRKVKNSPEVANLARSVTKQTATTSKTKQHQEAGSKMSNINFWC